MKIYDGVTNTIASLIAAAGFGLLTQLDTYNQPQGRLTFQSGTPVMVASIAASPTVYYTPYQGNRIPINVGGVFLSLPFAELSQALSDATKSPSAAVASGVYDYFGWLDTSVTPAVVRVTRGPSWTEGATAGTRQARGTGAASSALTRLTNNGLMVNAYAITNGPAAGYGTYLGTLFTDAALTSGSATVSWTLGGSGAGGVQARIALWNMYNRVKWGTTITDTTVSWTYATSTWRYSDNSANMSVVAVRGLNEEPVRMHFSQFLTNASASAGHVNIGLNGTVPLSYGTETPVSTSNTVKCEWEGYPGLGVNTLYALEYVVGSQAVTYYGTNNNAPVYGNGFTADGTY